MNTSQATRQGLVRWTSKSSAPIVILNTVDMLKYGIGIALFLIVSAAVTLFLTELVW